jgi:hypothetical protein
LKNRFTTISGKKVFERIKEVFVLLPEQYEEILSFVNKPKAS